MKKRKTYEISVIDKTYSKTISDETKFYTSDTVLELGFELKETDYIFESAEIVLLNIDDRSLVTRPVAKVDKDFVYELEDDIISHYGEWRGQLRFEQDGEVYVSSPVKFRIENDLSNDRPPQLSDVQSWVSLKRYADSLTDELKQAVLSVKGIEDTFNTNETTRQNQFETAEQSRQDTFETNEIERNETFNANEDVRKAQELEREEAESQRQTVFDDNETNRTETFNTNEATRQENETTRQQAETQRQSTFEVNEQERQTTFETVEQERQSAEQQRIEAETLRVENDSKREIEITKIKEDVIYYSGIKLVNLLKNGNFSEGYTNWVKHAGVSLTSVDDYVNVQTTSNYAGIYQNNLIMTNTNKYYGYCYAKSTVKVQLNTTNSSVGEFNTGENFSLLSTIFEKTPVRFSSFGVALITPGVFSIKEVGLIDLTKIFGKGNEPTKGVMDWIIKENGYFEELTLKRDDIQQYEINQLRKAVIALGGTI